MLRPSALLAYHGVGVVEDEADPRRLVTAPALLDRHVGFLQRLGYRFLTAEELLKETVGEPPRPGTAVLTFDDGWADAVDAVLPLLLRRGMRATFYICPSRLGGTHPDVYGDAGRLLDAEGVRVLVDAGMEVASHSLGHRDLRTLPDDELADDLVRSKAEVETLTGRRCRTFAYPFGFRNRRVEEAVQRAGYELAFTWGPGPWHRFAAPRLPAPPRHGAARLALKLLGIRRRVTA